MGDLGWWEGADRGGKVGRLRRIGRGMSRTELRSFVKMEGMKDR